MPRTKQIHLDSDLFAEPNSKKTYIPSIIFYDESGAFQYEDDQRLVEHSLLSSYLLSKARIDDDDYEFFLWTHHELPGKVNESVCLTIHDRNIEK